MPSVALARIPRGRHARGSVQMVRGAGRESARRREVAWQHRVCRSLPPHHIHRPPAITAQTHGLCCQREPLCVPRDGSTTTYRLYSETQQFACPLGETPVICSACPWQGSANPTVVNPCPEVLSRCIHGSCPMQVLL